jgi:hypothetical protein
MKTTCLLFLTMIWATLMQGTGYAVPASPASQQTPPASSANTASGHPHDSGQAQQLGHGRATDPNQRTSRATLTGLSKAKRPKQLPNSGPRSTAGNALPEPRSDKLGNAAKGGFIGNETVNHALPVRTSGVVRPAVPSLHQVHHRSPNPAVVGGSPPSHNSNAGAINGTRMNRKR